MQLGLVVVALLVSVLFCSVLTYAVSSNTRASMQKLEAVSSGFSSSFARYGTAAFELVDHTLKQGRSDWLGEQKLKDHRAFYSDFPNFKSLIIQVAIIDASGHLVVSSIAPVVEPIYLGDREHFRVHANTSADSLFVGQPVVGRVSGRLTLQVSRRITRDDGSFAGVIVASASPDFLEDFFDNNELRKALSFGLVGVDRNPLIWYGSHKPQPPLKVAHEDKKPPGSDLKREHFLSHATRDMPAVSWNFEPLPNFPLGAVVGVDASTLTREAARQELIASVLGAFFLLAITASTFFMVRGLRWREQMLLKLQESQIKANSANEMKTRFLADMSHELRTPLNGILGFSELVSRSVDIEKSRKYGQLINGSGKHLHQLVNTLLDLAKIEAGRMDIGRTECDLREVCDSLIDIHRYAAEKKMLTLEIDFAADLPLTICTDRIKLMQILNNVIHNALKFTERGSVLFHVAQDGLFWIFRISDTGIGMNANELERLFDRFSSSSLKSQNVAGQAGSGLGMALCKELTELLGGKIVVTSTEGIGTVVEIRLPINHEKEVRNAPEH